MYFAFLENVSGNSILGEIWLREDTLKINIPVTWLWAKLLQQHFKGLISPQDVTISFILRLSCAMISEQYLEWQYWDCVSKFQDKFIFGCTILLSFRLSTLHQSLIRGNKTSAKEYLQMLQNKFGWFPALLQLFRVVECYGHEKGIGGRRKWNFQS